MRWWVEVREVLPKSVSDHFDILTNYPSYIKVVSKLTVVIFPKYSTFYINVKEDCGSNWQVTTELSQTIFIIVNSDGSLIGNTNNVIWSNFFLESKWKKTSQFYCVKKVIIENYSEIL